MKRTLALSFLALANLACLAPLGFARTTAGQSEQAQDSGEKVRRITGCLQKGDGDNEYKLLADNGSTWEVKNNSSVDLSQDVGYTVTLTGTVNHAAMHNAKEKAKDKTMDNPNEHGSLTPTNVKTVSKSCSK